MLKQILIPAIIVLASCGQQDKENKAAVLQQPEQQKALAPENKIDNALAFINGYTENANKLGKAAGILDWINSNDLSTKSFKAELKKMLEEAYERDPELGPDADPVFDAQDYPDKGFVAEAFDEETNYLLVKGKNQPEFKLTMKVAQENGRWLVDGCGMINIETGKRAAR